VVMSNRGQAHKVDEKWMSLCKQDGVSPAHNKARVNLRTMSAGRLRRLEKKVEERQGWELTRIESRGGAGVDTEDRRSRLRAFFGKGGFTIAGENTKTADEGFVRILV
jgi:hypothetical protein